MNGSCWETTPDGREGWLHLLLKRGYEVHIVDNVERGRAGFAPGIWTGDPLLRSMQEAWSLFRIGAAKDFENRHPFESQQFPVTAFDAFAKGFSPRWLTTSDMQVAAMTAVLDRLGLSLVICHSQGAEIAFRAHSENPTMVNGIIAIEPSYLAQDLDRLKNTPVVILQGDYLDTSSFWQGRADEWTAFIRKLKRRGAKADLVDTAKTVAPGGSHMLMMDHHNQGCLKAGLAECNGL